MNSDSPVFHIPWGHNKLIIDKCKGDKDKALFFVTESLSNNWSRAVLMNFLDTNLYERKGKAVTNFKLSLPAEQSDLAQQITRDPYNFDFLTLRSDYNKKELKDALMDNLQDFFLELGKGFALLGREYRLEVGNTEQFLDMLFYNVQLHCYIVVEIKVRDFDPRDMGQLTTYVAAVDGMLRSDKDAQTICMSMHCVMHFILNGRVESSRRCRIFIIVNGCRIQVSDLLIELSFAGTNLTDTL